MSFSYAHSSVACYVASTVYWYAWNSACNSAGQLPQCKVHNGIDIDITKGCALNSYGEPCEVVVCSYFLQMAGEKLSLEQFTAVLKQIDSGLGPAASQLWRDGVNTEALLRKLTKQDMQSAGINLGNRVVIYDHFHNTDAGLHFRV